MTDAPDTDPTCPYCDRAFARESYRDLHLGVDHEARLTDAERDRYRKAREAEQQELRLFRYKALGLLVVVYFGFVILYAFSLGAR